MDCAVSEDQSLDLKEREMTDEYLDLDRELRKLWKMKMVVMSVFIEAL